MCHKWQGRGRSRHHVPHSIRQIPPHDGEPMKLQVQGAVTCLPQGIQLFPVRLSLLSVHCSSMVDEGWMLKLGVATGGSCVSVRMLLAALKQHDLGLQISWQIEQQVEC